MPWAKIGTVSIAVVCAVIVGFGWLMSSPPGSSPDEDFHLASTWCAEGIRASYCEQSPTRSNSLVLPKLVIAQTCFAHNSAQSGACRDSILPSDRQTLWRDFANQTGAYPGLYYSVMSVFVSEHTLVSIYLIRIANFLAVLLLFGAVFWLAPFGLRQVLAGSWLVTLIPLGVSLFASVNPSGWAIAGVGLFWSGLMGFPHQNTTWRRVAMAMLIGVAVVFACVRRDSTIYLGIVAVAAVFQSEPLRASIWKRKWLVAVGGLVIAVAGASVLIGLRGEVLKVLTPGRNQGTPALGMASADLLASNVENSLQFVVGNFGTWGLGQLDTTVPWNVPLLVSCGFFGLVALGLGRSYIGKGLALALVGGCLMIVPLVILQSGHLLIGQGLQPRYFLPLVLVLAGIALAPRRLEAGIRFSASQRWLVAGAIAIAQAIALHAYLRRYISGSDVASWNLNVGVEWWWTWMPSPMASWFIVSLAFAGLCAMAIRLFRTSGSGQIAQTRTAVES
jgi:hypothetical protein